MTDIPTLTYVSDAKQLLDELALKHKWVSVFWDKRDRRTPEISIIVDGHGDQPKAWLTGEVYAALVDSRAVGEDTYAGFHARRIHDFKAPPTPEKTGPTSNEVAENVVRDLVDTHPELPIRAAFFRGINKGNTWNPIREEIVETAAVDGGWFVLLKPGHSDVCLSAWQPDILGGDIIGGGVADALSYPRTADGVDLDVLGGREFREQLLTAIREKAALIETTRAAA